MHAHTIRHTHVHMDVCLQTNNAHMHALRHIQYTHNQSLSLSPPPPFPPSPFPPGPPSPSLPHLIEFEKGWCHKTALFHNFQGESIGPNEATEAFFAMTKLFQSKDVRLRVINCLFHFTG